MKFSGKMSLTIILKVTKKQGFTLSLADTLLEKPKERGQIDLPSLLRVKSNYIHCVLSQGFTKLFHTIFTSIYIMLILLPTKSPVASANF